MEISKATWTNDGEDTFSLSMSISKVDQNKRLVFGWATLDNVDTQDDVVTFEASQNAFAKFRGNLREMHQPIAAGRVVDYRPQQYYDENGDTYNGIYVSAYVSEGADSTWKKVLDGTLSAFSINGTVNKAYTKFDERVGKMVRYVEDYTMRELSLVDAGGNSLTNLVSVVKSVDGSEHLEGEMANVEIENVFVCAEDRLVERSREDAVKCQNGHDMTNIGWVEAKTPHTMEKCNALVKEHLREISKSVEGGVHEMAENAEVTEVAAAEEAPVVEEAKAEEVVDETPETATEEEEKTEESAKEEEEAAEEDAADALSKALDAAVESFRNENSARVEEIMKDIDGKFDALREEFVSKFEAYESKQDEIAKSLESVTNSLGEMSKSVDGLQDDSAKKKSGDLGGSPEGDVLSKSVRPGVWQGAIL